MCVCVGGGRVIGIQTSVPAVVPAVAYELSPAPLGFGPGVPGEHCLRQSPIDERALVEVQIPVEKFQHITVREKRKK